MADTYAKIRFPWLDQIRLAPVDLPPPSLLLVARHAASRYRPAEQEARFDEPAAAARHDLVAPAAGGCPAGNAAAVRSRGPPGGVPVTFCLPHRSRHPAALPQARVWLSGSGVTALERSNDAGILDAWTPLGPGNIGGRTRVVRFHPTVPTTLFAAGVSGGIWKSDDNGTTWRPTGDGLINIAVNALAIDPCVPR